MSQKNLKHLGNNHSSS